jgi:hypothetical protein
LIAFLVPGTLIRIFSRDPRVIAFGSRIPSNRFSEFHFGGNCCPRLPMNAAPSALD